MQTFLPYPDFQKSAECLDDRRLNKQILEASQIYKIVKENRRTGGWTNHPAVRIWRGYADALALYHNICLREWLKRGRNHSFNPIEVDENKVVMPHWIGKDEFHASHRSNLLRKMPDYYKKFGWKEPDNLPYVWIIPDTYQKTIS